MTNVQSEVVAAAVRGVTFAMQEAAMYGNALGLEHIVTLRDEVAMKPWRARIAVRIAQGIRNSIPDTPTYIDAHHFQ